MNNNESILVHVESLGGGYVWDAEVFAVSLLDVAVSEVEVDSLYQLQGMQQLAINAEVLSFNAIVRMAKIPKLESLVLANHNLSLRQVEDLKSYGPNIELITE